MSGKEAIFSGLSPIESSFYGDVSIKFVIVRLSQLQISLIVSDSS